MTRSFGLLRFAVAVVVAVVSLGLSGCVADPPPIIGSATPVDAGAVVSWQAPLSSPAPIAAYVVTPWIGFARQTPAAFNASATTALVTGLANGVTYTFTVHAVSDNGNSSAESAMSSAVIAGTRLAGGWGHSCAIVAGGAVHCWGANTSGQLGNGGSHDSLIAGPVRGITGAVALSAGHSHACAVVAGGAVKCWGWNVSGQLGNGNRRDQHTPVSVTGISGAVALAAGDQHTCAVVSGGAVKCWGSNYRGQLGNGTTIDSLTPVSVSGLTGAVKITASLGHTCALVSGGTLRCWGANYSGALGDGTTTGSALPVPVAGMGGVVDVAAGGSSSESLHTCALLVDGAAKCWGSNVYGQLGNGITTFTPTPTPMSVNDIGGATGVGAGDNHTCAIVSEGALKCWGLNVSGQLGNGSYASSSLPVSVVGVTGTAVITAGDSHTCAVVIGEAEYCWGYNSNGQLGDGTTTSSSSPVAVIGP